MGILGKIFGSGIGEIVESVGNVADKFITTDAERSQFQLEAEKVITERLRILEESARDTVQARMQVVLAELQSGDPYVSRTRPMIARWGLYVIIWNHAAVPTFGAFLQAITGSDIHITSITLPEEFWWTWGGVVSAWSIGRSFEKFGVTGPVEKASKLLSGTRRHAVPEL